MALSVTMVSPWITTSAAASASRTPCASLTLVTASRPTITSLSLNSSFSRSPLLHSSFRSSSLSGLSLGLDWTRNVEGIRGKRRGLVVRAGKAALCQTKRSRSRKSLARTHGFRRRMRTPGGRAILKRRRAKGRKVLCTKTHPNSGK